MWPGTVAPHCGHLLRVGACHRLAARRVRRRIFEVLRLGTPISLLYFCFQLFQRIPCRRGLLGRVPEGARCIVATRGALPVTATIALGVRGQGEVNIFPRGWRQVNQLALW